MPGSWAYRSGLILHGEGVYRYPLRLHRIDVFGQVVRECAVELRQQGSMDQRAAGLHPAGRTPGRRHHTQAWVEGQCVAHDRNNRVPDRRDREMRERGIGLAVRHVVEAVMCRREVRRTDGQTDEADLQCGRGAEQFLHQGGALRAAHAGADQPGRGIGDRGSEADHRLVAPRRIDLDRGGFRRGTPQRHVRAARQLLAAIHGRHPDLYAMVGLCVPCMRRIPAALAQQPKTAKSAGTRCLSLRAFSARLFMVAFFGCMWLHYA